MRLSRFGKALSSSALSLLWNVSPAIAGDIYWHCTEAANEDQPTFSTSLEFNTWIDLGDTQPGNPRILVSPMESGYVLRIKEDSPAGGRTIRSQMIRWQQPVSIGSWTCRMTD